MSNNNDKNSEYNNKNDIHRCLFDSVEKEPACRAEVWGFTNT